MTLETGSLRTSIVITNAGDAAFNFHVLLHTYLKIDDINTTTVSGLGETEYSDKVEGFKIKTQAAGDITFSSETDRVYKPAKGAEQEITVSAVGKPVYSVTRDNLADVVVWNPWSEKVHGVHDFAPKEGYRNMLCIEPGSVSSWQTLEPNEAFEGAQLITLV